MSEEVESSEREESECREQVGGRGGTCRRKGTRGARSGAEAGDGIMGKGGKKKKKSKGKKGTKGGDDEWAEGQHHQQQQQQEGSRREERGRGKGKKEKKKKKGKHHRDGKDWQELLEDTKLETQLRDQGFLLRDVTGDGNCMFRAISDQVHGAENHHRKFRESITDFMLRQKDYFAPFVSDEQTFEQYSACGEQVDTIFELDQLAFCCLCSQHHGALSPSCQSAPCAGWSPV